ncbi:hypothetical protein KFK09_005468 [Dendrobium nobile]|uniref:sucrose synthase n=1 Tax=Dendrobium nobile TaxID=94219 RepID=A0A8T3BZ94_DENNO|nr:hypothetical protein KFK09_005468 [Dendrobium nobile]
MNINDVEVYGKATGCSIMSVFTVGVKMHGLYSTCKADLMQCSQTARCNDCGQLGVVILSPHGHFAQANVLGYSDTGGPIVYFLDQVRALENELLLRINQQ